MKYQDKSKAYVEALALNAVTLEEIIAWADRIIRDEQEPRIEFIELSSSKCSSEAITQLNKLASGADEELSYKILFGLLSTALQNGSTSYTAAAKRLYFWSMYETDLKGYNEFGSFWDAIDLADRGSYGDPQEVRKNMLMFINEKKT